MGLLEQLREPSKQCWAFHKQYGWIVFERGAVADKPGVALCLLRCQDWTEVRLYADSPDVSDWISATMYLDTLPRAKAAVEAKRLAEFRQSLAERSDSIIRSREARERGKEEELQRRQRQTEERRNLRQKGKGD